MTDIGLSIWTIHGAPTNKLADRALRPLVIMRKRTFEHDIKAGAKRMTKDVTVKETGNCHGRNSVDIFYQLYT